MRYFKSVNDGYIIGVGTGNVCTEINKAEYDRITEIFHSKPIAPEGYDYRLKDTLEWELYEIPTTEEQTAYTAEQLEAMTSTELREICSEMGISGTMTKANMIQLILGKQNEVTQ